MSKAKPKLQYTYDHKNERFHFFASSITKWQANKDLDDLIRRMHTLYGLTIVIHEGELIVGNRSAGSCAGIVFPESGISWLTREIDILETRPQDRFQVRPEDRAAVKGKSDCRKSKGCSRYFSGGRAWEGA